MGGCLGSPTGDADFQVDGEGPNSGAERNLSPQTRKKRRNGIGTRPYVGDSEQEEM